MLYIGIDPGTHTGLAVWDTKQEKLLSADTLKLHQALDKVRTLQASCTSNGLDLCVVFEDARQRKWYTGNSDAKKQGAGSIKRDCSIWEEFLVEQCIRFQALPPSKGMTKVAEDYFRMITGYQGRTSNHARDAAMLVIGRR